MRTTPFNEFMGIELVRGAEGEVELAIDLRPHHLNRKRVAHGGVVSTLLDSALGGAVISAIPPEWWCTTVSLSIQFVSGAAPGRLVGTGRVVRRGRAVAFARGEVHDSRGKLVATAEGSWHLWPHHPGLEQPVEGAFVTMRGSGERLRVGKVLCVGRNYADHVTEMGAPRGRPPVLFLKPATAVLHDGGVVRLPARAGEVHHEVELVAVIGKPGKAIPVSSALDHVLGYAVGLDLTLRDVQSEAKKRGEPWLVSKGFDGSAPVSLVAAASEVGDGSGLEITLDVNGERRQQASTSRMIFPVAELIALASRTITLERGDLLLTGTPAGVGPIRAGDRLEAAIEKVGKLTVTVEAEPEPQS